MALIIAAEGRHDAGKEHRRCYHQRGVAAALAKELHDDVDAEDHAAAEQRARHQEGDQRNFADLPHLFVAAQGVGFGHDLGHRHRQTHGGHGVHSGVDIIGLGENGGAVCTVQVAQGNGKQSADDLDQNTGQGQNQRALHKVFGTLLAQSSTLLA